MFLQKLLIYIGAILIATACSPVSFSSNKSGALLASAPEPEGPVAGQPTPKPESTPKAPPLDPSIDPSNPESIRGFCQAMKPLSLFSVQLADNAEVKDMEGNGIYRASHIRLMERTTGNFFLFGTNAQAKVDQISEGIGNYILCGMSVGKLTRNLGNVIVVGGNVDQVVDFAGNLIVVDGQIGAMSGVTGNVSSF